MYYTKVANNNIMVTSSLQPFINCFRFKSHFDVIFIDEVDAFPLSMDPRLMEAIRLSSKQKHSHIFMTATPRKELLNRLSSEQIITLPARFHKTSTTVPKFHIFQIKR